MDPLWHIELFGWLRAVPGTPEGAGDRVVSRFRTRKAEALLAYLAYHAHRSHPREQLIERLWPGDDPYAGRCRLRTELASLRHQLEPPGIPAGAVLLATRTTIQLNPDACVTDVARFETALLAAKRAGCPADCAQQLTVASVLYGGELLPGCFEEWILPERQRLAEAFLGALHALVGLREEIGDRPGALHWARRAVAADPLGEESHHRLIRLLLADGQVEAARTQYEQGQEMLLRELGAGLSSEISALISDLAPAKDRRPATPAEKRGQRRRQSPRPSPPAPPAGPTSSPPPGEDGETGKPRQQPGAPPRPNCNLPRRFTRFFGREPEIERLVELLSGAHPRDTEPWRGAAAPRLVTMTGPGGSGKTRLALQVAERIRNAFPGGAWFVSLWDLTDPTLIPDQILLSLRLTRTPHLAALEQVITFLSATPSLLLLDNYEHLIEDGALAVQTLLQQVEHLTLLVTSRQRLGLEGEQEFPVAPLPVPADFRFSILDFGLGPIKAPIGPVRPSLPAIQRPKSKIQNSQALLACPSVALFVDRAQAVRPDFQVTAYNAAAVADLCQRLEGLPLAIELAAARSGVFTPQQMLARLGQRFELLAHRQRSADPRHRSLRATMDWSYQLLAQGSRGRDMQRFFARLSVFRGGWTAAAAEAVCEMGGAIVALERLRESSLVQTTETGSEIRFHLLETLREYGAEQLTRDEKAVLALQHAQFFLALAETAERELAQGDLGRWLGRLEQEHDNLRAALAWSIEAVDSGQWPVASEVKDSESELPTVHWPLPTAIEIGLRLGSALEPFWDRRGYLQEGRDELLRLLAQPGAAAPTAARARVLGSAGWFTRLHHDLEAARRLQQESLTIWRALEDRAGIATALLNLGWLAVDQWDSRTARPLVEESLTIRRESDDPRGIADALHCLAWVARHEGDLVAARTLAEESLSLSRALADRARIVGALGSLAHMTVLQGDMTRARPLIEENMAAARELDDKVAIAWGITRLGFVAHWQEDYPAARARFEQSLPLWRKLDAKDGLTETLFHLASTLQHQGDHAAAYAIFEEMVSIAREWGFLVRESLTLLGNAAGHLGRWEEAAARCAESLRPRRGIEAGGRHVVAWGLIGMARVALARARPARAVRLLGAAEALWAASTAPRWPNERADFERLVSAARSQLDEAEFDAAWADGEAMPVEPVIAEALQEAPAG